MKFEKFFKATGTHGMIVKRSEAESWLVCDGVGMVIPRGVNNLGINCEPKPLFKAIVNSNSEDDILTLKEAILKDPEGKARDIIRVFETELGDRIGIYNSAYGLIERKDQLTYLEIETEDENDPEKVKVFKFMVVRDRNNETIGYIAGCEI
jgi:hypothetical protein